MKIKFLGQELNVKLTKVISEIEPDAFIENRYFVFLPKSQLCRLHKIFAGEEVRLPNDRESLLEFDKSYENITLSINGSSDDTYYKEEISDIEFTEQEKKIISAALKTVA